jgi:hypothetical protein
VEEFLMMQKRFLSIAGVGILAILAMVGCNTSPQPVSAVNPAVDVPSANAYPPANNYTTEEEPAYGMRPPVRTVSPQQFEGQAAYPEQPYGDPGRPHDVRQSRYADRNHEERSQRVYEERRPRVVTRERSFGHSAAIVGGSAGAGAVIGAVAGGGKGAGIGALAGGAGGFIYDRLTHKKREVEER